MRRFFTEPENVDGQRGVIKIVEDAAHISRVLRMEPGDKVLVFDGSGTEYTAELTEIGSGETYAKILSSSASDLEPKIRVTLFQGIPKSGKLDVIVQKAVELGVFEIVPFRAARSVAKISDDKKGAQKIERLNKISKEAAKQCGRGLVHKVHMPVSVPQMAKMLKELDMSIMFYEELGHMGTRNLKSVLQEDAETIGIIIGPEGGFSHEEAQLLTETAGVRTAGLGRRILRTETAGSTALSIIMYEKNEI